MNQRVILQIDNLPIQQNRVFDTVSDAVNCKTGNIVLIQDEQTGIVHNAAFDPAVISYDANYQNEQAYSSVFQQHLHAVVEIIKHHFTGMSLIEIGCGKGKFLEVLRKNGFDVIGVDPAYEGNSPFVIKEYFSPGLLLKGDAVILRHILEHISDPIKFLSVVAATNNHQGLVYIEVPCLDWIGDHQAWFDVFYEHVNYFRLSDFERIFGKILESGHIFNGQYLYIIADLSTLKLVGTLPQASCFNLPDNFFLRLDQFASMNSFIKLASKVIWGAGSKGTLFALHITRKYGKIFDFSIDINPAKQNKYLPVTGLPILDPEAGLAQLEPGSLIYVMNSNYYQEIKEIGGNKFIYHKVDQDEF